MLGQVVRFLLLAVVAVAAQSLPAAAERRVALLIGNGAYQHAPKLPNPARDVEAVGAVLERAGYEVIRRTDLSRFDLQDTLAEFVRELSGADVALFYYSGHAVQVAGKNFLIPVDASLEKAEELEVSGVDVDTVLSLVRPRTKVQLVFLDACRDNPFEDKAFSVGVSRSTATRASRGLAQIPVQLGTLIAFSTDPGNVALDGDGAMSPFSAAFARHAGTPNLELRSLLTRIRNDVISETKGKQRPWENSSLTEDVYIVPRRPAPVVPDLVEVRVPAGTADTSLALEAPAQPAGGDVLVRFDRLPAKGVLILGGTPVSTELRIAARDVPKLAYRAEGVALGTTELASYVVSDAWGNEVRGVIAFAMQAGGEASVVATPVAKAADPAELESVKNLGAKRFDVLAGLGPRPLGIDAAVFRSTAALRLEVVKAPSEGTLAIGGTLPLGNGGVLTPVDLPKLTYEPSRRPVRGSVEVEIAVKDVAGNEMGRTKLELRASLHPCDVAAADPFDPQGVGAGVLPDKIDLAQAETACAEAAAEHPEVPRFLFELGRVLLGKGEFDGARAAFERAATKGHVRALQKLGSIYEKGAGVPIDRAKAAELYREAADKGDPYGAHSYGKMLLRGLGIEQDKELGFSYLMKAADVGHTFAFNELGWQFLEGKILTRDTARGLAFLKASHEAGDIYGTYNLGLAYLTGVGVSTDYAEAYRYLLEASKKGQPSAPNEIGRMFQNGWSVEPDAATALDWYGIAADRGDAWGASNAGWIRLNGPKQLRDPVAAARFYALAVALDKPDASPEAAKALAAIPAKAKAAAIVELAKAAGLGAKADLARFAQANGAGAKDTDKLLTALARERFLKDKPRLDLL